MMANQSSSPKFLYKCATAKRISRYVHRFSGLATSLKSVIFAFLALAYRQSASLKAEECSPASATITPSLTMSEIYRR